MDDDMSERMQKAKMMQDATKKAVERSDTDEAVQAAKKAKALRAPKGGFAQLKNGPRVAF